MKPPGAIVREIAASVWSAVAASAAIMLLHLWWFVESEHKADVISGFGVATAVLGILVAAQPLISTGIKTTARRQVGLVSEQRRKDIEDQAHDVEARARQRVIREQIAGAALIAIGTLYNGYAGALAHLFSLPV